MADTAFVGIGTINGIVFSSADIAPYFKGTDVRGMTKITAELAHIGTILKLVCATAGSTSDRT